jgi:hypothetical protein
MSIFGKLLAVLNLLAALGLAYVALMDYTQRQKWAYAVYRMDFPNKGLPVDEDEIDSDGQKRIDRITDETIQDLFKPVGGLPGTAVLREDKTQLGELKRVYEKLNKDIQGQADEAKKRALLQSVLLALATNLSERNDIQHEQVKDLMAKFEKAFSQVLGKPGLEPADARGKIAHLLLAASQASPQPEQARQRVAVVVGLKAFTHEVNLRAHALQDMSQQVHAEMVAERGEFDRNQRRILHELDMLARDLEERKEELDRRQLMVNRHNVLVKAREADIAQLRKEIDAAAQATKAAFSALAAEQDKLFGIQAEVGAELKKNQRLEQEIRTVENIR